VQEGEETGTSFASFSSCFSSSLGEGSRVGAYAASDRTFPFPFFQKPFASSYSPNSTSSNNSFSINSHEGALRKISMPQSTIHPHFSFACSCVASFFEYSLALCFYSVAKS